jgi:hypothetical protein
MGFNLEQYSDPKANILTAMNRMVDAGEMSWVEGAPKKTVEAGPELKPIPEAPQTPPPGVGPVVPFLSGLATQLVREREEEKKYFRNSIHTRGE